MSPIMRIRLPELFQEHGLTAYEIAKRSDGRLQASSLYRLARRQGAIDMISSDTIDALCDVLGVEVGEILERGKKRRGRAA